MSLERCPGCRARLTEDPVCTRCGCDLTLVRRAEAQARQLVCRTLTAWAEGNPSEAAAFAAAALALEHGALGRAVRYFLSSSAAPVRAAEDRAGPMLRLLEEP